MQVRSKLVDAFSFFIIVICSIVLSGWALENHMLITFSGYRVIGGGIESMKPVTAICFIAFSVALLLEVRGLKKITRWITALIIACAIGNVITYDTRQLLFFNLNNVMSIATACIFMIGGVAFMLCTAEKNFYKSISDILIVVGFYLALYGLYGYVIDYKALYSIHAFSSLSLPTTLAFLLLMLSMPLLYPERGALSIFYSNSLGGLIARRLLTIAFFLPILTGFIVSNFIYNDFLSNEIGILIIVTTLSLIMTMVGLNISMVVHKIDSKNQMLLGQTRAYNRELKTAEEKLKQQNLRLLTINQYLDNFVHAVAHNLRGVVTNIKALLHLRQVNPDFQVNIIDEKLTTSVDQLDDTLINLVKLIELQSETDYVVHQVKFEDAMKKAVSLYHTELDHVKATVSLDFNEKESIWYSPEYLESITRNLLSNSLKYRHDERPLHVSVNTRKENGYALLKFSDNGIGIRPTIDHQKAFVPFKRLTTIGKGKGLGLFIVKSMVEKNGGKVDIFSNFEQGTDVLIYFKEYDSCKVT